MKTALRLGILVIALWPGVPAFAEDRTLENRLQQVEEELRQYRSTLKQYQEHERREGASGTPEEPGIEIGRAHV